MPNKSKLRDRRFIKRWVDSGAIKCNRIMLNCIICGHPATEILDHPIYENYRGLHEKGTCPSEPDPTTESSEDTRPWWVDEVGDKLEAEGVRPDCIFEFHDHIHEDLEPGGVVVSKLGGEAPKQMSDISRVFVKDVRGEVHEMGINRPIFLFNCHKITGFY